MPIYNAPLPSIKPTPLVPTTPSVKDTSSMFMNKDHPRHVINQIDGSSWVVNYYSTVLGKDDVLVNSQDTIDPTIKQYIKILKYELRVIEPLTPSIDDTTGVTTVIGGANCYSSFTPVVGDVFIATVSTGVKAIFEVVATPQRSTMYDDSLWKINYALVEYLNLENLELLNSYVVGELIFDVTRLGTNLNPLITKSENNRVAQKEEIEKELVSYFYSNYFDKGFNTFFVPDELNRMVYDSHMVEFWNKLMVNKFGSYPTEYSVDFGSIKQPYVTVLDAIITQDKTLVKSCIVHLHEENSAFITNIPFNVPAARLSGIDYIIKPRIMNGKATRFDDITSPTPLPYIFTLSFYGGLNDLPPIEVAVRNLLDKQVLNYNDVYKIYVEVMGLTDERRKFYFIPILLCLLKVVR